MLHLRTTPEGASGDSGRAVSHIPASDAEADDPMIRGSSHDARPASQGIGDFKFDTFAMTSLQSTAAAILAAHQQIASPSQQQQHSHLSLEQDVELQNSNGTMSGSESETSRSRQASPHGQARATSPGRAAPAGEKTHIERHMWSTNETQALVDGCNKHGIGNWKAILQDQQFNSSFVGRTAGDLKDRFRTYFPDAYHEMYPNAKTHTSRAVRSKAADGSSIFEKGKTKERRPFSPAEDDVLKRGYEKFGSHWAIIAKESVFEGKRKSTDLRDRFRNAFPYLYEQAGYKPRTKTNKKERRQSSTGSATAPHERTALLSTEVSPDGRPCLAPRSETSTSAHSQAVSEHSEEEESDNLSLHWQDRSEKNSFAFGDTSLQNAATSMMSRSHSLDLAAVQALTQQGARATNEEQQSAGPSHASRTAGPAGGSATGAAMSHKAPLRRSQSSKRGAAKISTLENAVKNASIKCNKEVKMSNHLHHHQHSQLQQQSHSQSVQQSQDAVMSGIWADRFAWDPKADNANSSFLADMDLDHMDDIIHVHPTSQLMGNASSSDNDVRLNALQPGHAAHNAFAVEATATGTSNASANNALLADLYRNLGLEGSSFVPSSRSVAVDSFQDLLDPLGPAHTAAGPQWSHSSGPTTPWTPISSTAAPQVAVSSPATAQRRDHEHNQWAGDLLHRGNFATLGNWNPEAFVNMANMQLSVTSGTPQPRPADLARPPAAPLSDRNPLQFSMGRPAMPSSGSTLSTSSVQDELLSRSYRRLSNPPRLASGVGDFGGIGSDGIFQAAYRNPYPYPADDMSLLNSGLGGNMTLFPSLENGSGGTLNDGVGGMGALSVRRRRSTDTLRAGAFNLVGQVWRNPMDGMQENEADDGVTGNSDRKPDGQQLHASSHHSGDHSRTLSSVDDDDDAPSRAASTGDLDLVSGGRNDALYAESLPDLTTNGEYGEHTSTTSETAFPIAQHMQMSFDDMDLPSFLNRSPGFAHANVASNGHPAMFSSPRLSSLVSDNNTWLKMAGTTMRVQREGPELHRSTSVAGGPGSADAIERGTPAVSHVVAGSAPFLSSFGDAGALDRLEHLYLEGLHTPSSPAMLGHGQAPLPAYSAIGPGYLQRLGGGVGSAASFAVPGDRNGGAGGDTGGGYESV